MIPRIELRRGGVVESIHRVHVAVVDAAGRRVAWAGDPGWVSFVRSAAKPMQALPLMEDGVVDALGISDQELALCCASHSGEPLHLEGVRSLLARGGISEAALECGPLRPLGRAAARALSAAGVAPERIHNNCSGKHAGMLLLAQHHGWTLEGYRLADHPVQRRMRAEVARWTGHPMQATPIGVDGCGVLCFALPVEALARGFAAFGAAASRGEAGPARVLEAMASNPFHVAGTGRLCTRVGEVTQGRVVAKVGAEGVYGALDRETGRGLALKVEDGGWRGGEVALIHALGLMGALSGEEEAAVRAPDPFAVPNSRGEHVAELVPAFKLEREE